MNKTIEDLVSRRSIRKYKSEQISEEELALILKKMAKLRSYRNGYAVTGYGSSPG